MAAKILLFGTYPLLMETYRLILERSGFDVFDVGSLQELNQALSVGQFHLCVLCSSVPAEDRREAFAMLSILAPGLRILNVLPGDALRGGILCGTSRQPAMGPEFLLSQIRELTATEATEYA